MSDLRAKAADNLEYDIQFAPGSFPPLFAYGRFSRRVPSTAPPDSGNASRPNSANDTCILLFYFLAFAYFSLDVPVQRCTLVQRFFFEIFFVFHLFNVLMIQRYFPSQAIHNDARRFYSLAGTPVNYPSA